MGGRTSLKDANANCTWLNEYRIAEETGGKYLATSGNRYFEKRSILLRNKMIKSKLKLKCK